MTVGHRIYSGTIMAALALAALAMVVPLPQSSLMVHADLAIVIIMATLNIGAASLFIYGLREYKAEMRKAYLAFASGIFVLAFATLQVAVLVALSLDNSSYARGIGIVLPFLLTGLLIYVGVRRFSRLVGVHSWLTKATLVIPGVIILSALSSLLPHVPGHPSPEMELDFSVGILFWITLLNMVSALIISQVNRRIGAHYVKALTLLQTFLFGSGIVSMVAVVINLTIADGNESALTITHVLSVALACVALRAGYEFSKTEAY